MNMKITKDSIEDCFRIIEQNGGVKAWQEMNRFLTNSTAEANEPPNNSQILTEVFKF